MENKLTPTTVEIKNFEEGFTAYGLAGDIYFNNKRIISFYTKNYTQMIDHINILEEETKEQILAYQSENEEDEFYQDVEGFVITAIDFHKMKKATLKSMRDFKKEYNVKDKKTIGAFIFKDGLDAEESYRISVFNNVAIDVSDTQLEELKEKAHNHASYPEFKHVYFMKYISERKTIIEQIK